MRARSVWGTTAVDVGLRVDALSAMLLVFVAVLGFIIATYSRHNLRGQCRVDRFGWLLSASYVSLALLVCGASLPIVAVGWTASGLLLTGLIAHRGTPSALRAAASVRARLLMGDGLLWAAVILASLALPSLNRAGLDDSVQAAAAAPLALITLLLVGACVVRSALVPAWSWLPQTAEAPAPVSAYLHAGVINGAGVLAALLWPLFRSAPVALAALLLLGALSAVIGTVAARTRPDVKGQLASSTTSQMGCMCVQLGLGLPAVAVLHVIRHGFYKACLFLPAGGEVTRRRDTPVPVASPNRGASALAVLRTIVNAPVVVAQWINAQYYFSSVDPEALGSGDKSTHNVVGDVGVITGACGDLRAGLPWQTLFSSEAEIGTGVGRHEPLRLSVVLYNSPSNVSSVLDASPHVRALVANQWIHVVAIDSETGMPWALQSDLTWTPWDLAFAIESAGVVAHSG